MSTDADGFIARISEDPQFHDLVRQRSLLAWGLSLLMVLIYFGFILAIAFQKELLGASLAGGVMTIGIPVGIGVIVSAFFLTGIYVRRANSKFDDMTREIIERARH